MKANCCIYKLTFTAPLHCGAGDGAVSLSNVAMLLRADTVFSALCNEANAQYGPEGAEQLIHLAQEDKLLLSDTFPYCGTTLYLPKPQVPLKEGVPFDMEHRKIIKAIHWLTADEPSWQAYAAYLSTGQITGLSMPPRFASLTNHTSVNIRSGEKDAKPFDVGQCEFADDCGLYGIFCCDDSADLDFLIRLFTSLGYSGIGGHTSRGMGKFRFETVPDTNSCAAFLQRHLRQPQAPAYLLLTASLPRPDEAAQALDGAYYSIIRRGGFSYSENQPSVKKQVQYFLAAGSVLTTPFSGDLYPVGRIAAHNIYRYAKPLFMGVNL